MRRIGSREVEQLLTADSGASAYPGLSDLLAAAAAPPRPDELVGLPAAMAAFEAAGRESRTSSAAVTSRRRGFARSVVVKVAAGVAVVLFGGTALAAETGNLPGASQRHAHELFSGLGVPAPPSARPAPTVPAASESAVVPTPEPSSVSPSRTPGPAGAATRGLCRSWQARQQNPKKKPMKAESLRSLTAAAGGAEHITDFCAALLTDDPSATTTQGPAAVSPTPSHPGKGKAKGHSKKE
ncbi:hypothetical protein DMB66_38625 [Actinoplanes sp. ATCC 53533]|uniref:hypothetical protein n=1 Tax=Actinoplanes sp. ATCC 53533 TaxID=1288362 RepID=UPI000F79C447|nr:hypothetical protein [Actinoplanes sp. ATCC 53533]RSM53721.1 hypothetical protein DMB66_38625 [Actinoplanes sp. ATCC 53533]